MPDAIDDRFLLQRLQAMRDKIRSGIVKVPLTLPDIDRLITLLKAALAD